MLKFIIFIVAGYFLIKLLTGDKRKKEKMASKEMEEKVAAGEMVRDPICGSFVSKESDIRVRHGQKVECFCSYDCRDKYLKQIEQGK